MFTITYIQDENGRYCALSILQTRASCYPKAIALTVTLSRLPDSITVTIPTRLCEVSVDYYFKYSGYSSTAQCGSSLPWFPHNS